jgi:LysM repeat protein/nicotinic acid mononucleotide adenylyltransferase
MVRKVSFIVVLLLALMISQAALAQDDDTFEMIGVIQTINPDGTIVINGQNVIITTAELNTMLAVGQTVKVEGLLLRNGQVIARQVNLPDDDDLRDDDEVELSGVVDSFDGVTLVVSGIAINAANAQLYGPIEIGRVIKVHASFDANGNLIAREAGRTSTSASTSTSTSTSTSASRPGEFEIVGTVSELGNGFVVVNGQRIDISRAEIKNQLMVGTRVKLHLRNENGALIAREVENARDDDSSSSTSTSASRPGEFEIVGTVSELGNGFVVVNGQRIDISRAEIKNQLMVGTRVKLHLRNENGALIAREVENARDDDSSSSSTSTSASRPGEFEIVGTLTEIGDGFIVVGGRRIDTRTAEIKNRLMTGTLVKLHLRSENGALIAREVENARNNDDDRNDDRGGRSSSGATWNYTYTIRPGDTLSSIAARTRTTVEEIARQNNIADIRSIVAGAQLILPNAPASFDDDDDDDDDRRGSSSGSGSSNSGRGSSMDDDDDDDDDRRGSSSSSSGSSSGRGSSSDDDDDDDSGDDDDDD